MAARPDLSWTDLIDALHRRHHAERGAVLIGASFGGLVASALAVPLAARALVLMNPLPPARPESRPVPALVAQRVRRWGLTASVAGSARAIPELAHGDALHCFRRWTDFSAGLLDEARADVTVDRPSCPVLILSSEGDRDIDQDRIESVAQAWAASLVRVPGTHVSPLLGRAWAYAFDVVEAWLGAIDASSR